MEGRLLRLPGLSLVTVPVLIGGGGAGGTMVHSVGKCVAGKLSGADGNTKSSLSWSTQ